MSDNMERAARAQALDRAYRENRPMRIYKRVVILTGEPIWYVRAVGEPAPEGAQWIADIQPETQS